MEFLLRHLALTRLHAPAAPGSQTKSASGTDDRPVTTTVDDMPVKYVRWPRTGVSSPITLVIWPEAAMPFLPLQHPSVLQQISQSLPKGAQLLAGILRLGDPSGQTNRVFNSAAVFGDDGQLTALYDKIHLVPFGEYLPFQDLLESIGLQTLTRQRGGFSTGAKPRQPLRLRGLPPASILICYEGIFAGAVVQTPTRPGLLINITNDGWFGNSTGPRQHLHQSRLRAVEEGVPLIRVANNGISAIFDAYGRELGRLEMNTAGVIDSALPGTIPAPIYSRFGDTIFAVLWLLLTIGLVSLTRRRG